jgi:hypothetical protein
VAGHKPLLSPGAGTVKVMDIQALPDKFVASVLIDAEVDIATLASPGTIDLGRIEESEEWRRRFARRPGHSEAPRIRPNRCGSGSGR